MVIGSPSWRVRWDTRLRYLRATGTLRRIVLYGVGVIVVFALAWIVTTGLMARSEAQRVEAQLRQVETLVTNGNITQAERVAAAIPGEASRAHSLTTGPAWWLASQVPYLGDPLAIVRGTTEAGYQIGSKGVPDLIQVAASLNPATLRTSGASINLEPLVVAAPKLQAAARTLDNAIRTVNRLPSSSWLGAVNGPRQRLGAELVSIGGYVDAANRAAQILPTMLGMNSPQRYFIGLQNEAEMRGTGGLPGTFAIVVADHGTLTFTHFESDDVLLPAATGQLISTGLNFGTDYQHAYGASQPTSLVVNSNLSPNFPYAAQIWAAMWEKESGEHVDGSIALDPTVLGGVLGVTGPVQVADGAVIDASDAVSVTEQQEYAVFTDDLQRKQFLVSVLKAVSTKITSQRTGSTELARVLSASASAQRLQVWSSDPQIETVLEQTNYAGAIPQTRSTFAGLVLNNVAAGKLDYYLVRGMSYYRTGCGNTRDVIVTITLNNTAPADLPPYVDTRLDHPDFPVNPGDNRTLMDYYATDGSQLVSATLDQQPTTVAVLTEQGHPIYRLEVELPRGTTQTIQLRLQEPATTGSPIIWRQPGVTPLTASYFAQSCG